MKDNPEYLHRLERRFGGARKPLVGDHKKAEDNQN